MTLRPASATVWRAALGLAVGLTLARCVVPLVWPHQFDSDEAIFGLMAKHLVEGRAFPLFMYGSPYMLGVEAWTAAVVFLVAGPHVVTLRLPLLVFNVATAWLLMRILHRDGGLSPLAALGASLPFVLAPPFLSTGAYMSASGGNIEPSLYVLLLWVLRRRPWWFGVLLGLGFLHRQFTAYGAVALLGTQAMDRSLVRKSTLEDWLIVTLTFAASWQAVDSLRVWSSPLGPGTSFTVEGREVLASAGTFACVAPATFVGGMRTFVTDLLPLMTGLEAHRTLATVFGSAAVLGAARIAWVLAFSRERHSLLPRLAPCVYIALVGLLSATGYVALRCGVVNLGTSRYALMAPFFLVGLAAAFFLSEPSRLGRRLAALVLCAWTLLPVTQFGALVGGYLRQPPANTRARLADHLVSQGVEHAIGDYWDAYTVTFLTKERVHVASDNVARITQYQSEFDERPDGRVRISRVPCLAGGYEAVPGTFWICPAEP